MLCSDAQCHVVFAVGTYWHMLVVCHACLHNDWLYDSLFKAAATKLNSHLHLGLLQHGTQTYNPETE